LKKKWEVSDIYRLRESLWFS